MDRYLFRGKRVDNGEWVEGYYHTNKLGNHFIIQTKMNDCLVLITREILFNAIGQCTGLKDKNGKLIFEGDKLKVTFNDMNPFNDYSLAEVKWMDDVSYPAFDLEFYQGDDHFDCNAFSWIYESGEYEVEIIGNIHDKGES